MILVRDTPVVTGIIHDPAAQLGCMPTAWSLASPNHVLDIGWSHLCPIRCHDAGLLRLEYGWMESVSLPLSM